MANEKLVIQPGNARLSITGRSWDNVAGDSGDGPTIDQIIIEELERITGDDFPDIDDDTHIIIGEDENGDPWLWIEGLDEPFDLGDLDLGDLDLGWELDTTITVPGFSITVDDDLKLKVENIPTAIEIVTLPKKLTFTYGKRIDITGMVVKAVKSDGTTWTSAKYPNGHIPLQELIVQPRVAGYVSMEDVIMKSGRCSDTVANVHFTATANAGATIFINENDERWMRVTFLSEYPGACGTFNNSPAYANTEVAVFGNRHFYMSQQYNYSHNCTLHLIPYYPDYVPLTKSQAEELIGGVNIIWRRPMDNVELSTSYEITVTEGHNGGGR